MVTQLQRKFETTEDELLYALGYSETEFRRLEHQGAFFGDLTEGVMWRAGIASGMRLLDAGCGIGCVSLLVGAGTRTAPAAVDDATVWS